MAEPRPHVPVLLVTAVFSRLRRGAVSGADAAGTTAFGPVATGQSALRLRSDQPITRPSMGPICANDSSLSAISLLRNVCPTSNCTPTLSKANWPPRRLSRSTAAQHRSGIAGVGQIPAGHHQGSGPSHLSARRHLRRGDVALSRRRVRAVAVDLRRLSPAVRSRVFAAGARLLSAAAAAKIEDRGQRIENGDNTLDELDYG